VRHATGPPVRALPYHFFLELFDFFMFAAGPVLAAAVPAPPMPRPILGRHSPQYHLPDGVEVIPTHARWNHSYGQSSFYTSVSIPAIVYVPTLTSQPIICDESASRFSNVE
jgi:hypothetical protein